MPERKIVYTVDINNSKLSGSAKRSIQELGKIGDFVKRDLGKIELAIKMKIDKKGALDDAKAYKAQLENILRSIRAGKIDVDYKQMSFLNRELTRTTGILNTYNGGFFNRINNGFKSLTSSFQNLAIAGGLIAGLNVVRNFLSNAFKEASDAAKSSMVFANSLKIVGLSVKDVQADIVMLSKTNAIDDDQIKQIYSYGVAMGIPKDRLKQFAQTALDFSAATGKTLEMSMRSITDEAKKGGSAFDDLTSSVAGSAGIIAQSDGGIQRLKVAYGEFSESIGGIILKFIEPAVRKLIFLIEQITSAIDKFTGGGAKASKVQLEGYRDAITRVYGKTGLFEKASIDNWARIYGIQKEVVSAATDEAGKMVDISKLLSIINGELKTKKNTVTSITNEMGKQKDILSDEAAGMGLYGGGKKYGRQGFDPASAQMVPLSAVSSEYSQMINDLQEAGKQLVFALEENVAGVKNIVDKLAEIGLITDEAAKGITDTLDIIGQAGDGITKIISGNYISGIIDLVSAAIDGIVAIVDAAGEEERQKKEEENRLIDEQINLERQRNEVIRQSYELQKKNLEGLSSTLELRYEAVAQTFDPQMRERFAQQEYERIQELIERDERTAYGAFSLTPGSIGGGDYNSILAEQALAKKRLEQYNKYLTFLTPLMTGVETIAREVDIYRRSPGGNIIAQRRINELQTESNMLLNPQNIATLTAQGKQAEIDAIMATVEANNNMVAGLQEYLYSLNVVADIQEEITGEIENQNDLLQKQQDILLRGIQTQIGGQLIDPENIADIGRIQSLLSSYGYSGGSMLSALSGLNLRGVTDYSRSQNIGTINIEVNEATGDTIDRAIEADIMRAFGRF